jgi:hypothetical protein
MISGFPSYGNEEVKENLSSNAKGKENSDGPIGKTHVGECLQMWELLPEEIKDGGHLLGSNSWPRCHS